MKKITLPILITLLSIQLTYSQSWQQLGQPGFASSAEDIAITHNSNGETFVAYTKISDNRKIYVEKFDGTNWVQIGTGSASNFAAGYINITISPLTQNPWVAYTLRGTSNFGALKFDSTSWVDLGIATGNTGIANKVQIQVDSNDHAFMASSSISYGSGDLVFYSNRTGSWVQQFVRSINGTPDLIAHDTIYYANAFPNSTNRLEVYKRSFDGTSWSPEVAVKSVYNINNNISSLLVTNASNQLIDRLGEIIEPSSSNPSFSNNSIVLSGRRLLSSYRNNPLNNSNYLNSQTNTDSVIIRENHPMNGWSMLPQTGIGPQIGNNRSKMVINPVSGGIYIVYNETAGVSVKYFNPPLDLQRVYVDENASGTNSGINWFNAFNSLQNALQNGVSASTSELWIAKGTYSPNTVDRTIEFTINKNNLKIYGGFDGTETSISQRDAVANPTILSGDLLNNDTSTVFDLSSLDRQDNSIKLLRITADSVLLDGITFSDAHSTTTSGIASIGAAVVVDEYVKGFQFYNCTFKNNYTFQGGAALYYFPNSTVADSIQAVIDRCIFRNNVGNLGSALYILSNNNITLELNIGNCLFTENVSKNTATSSQGYSGSSAWIRAYGTSSKIDLTMANSTFVNNADIGTRALIQHSTLGVSEFSGFMNARIANCIFWGNSSNSTAFTAIGEVNENAPASLSIFNSLDPDNFSNIINKNNILAGNPSFVSSTDFQLSSNSIAVNAGNSVLVNPNATLDLLGNNRIIGPAVDLGAYEYNPASVGIDELAEESISIKIFPNPARESITIQSDDLINEIRLFDVRGNMIQVIDNTDVRINVSHLPRGMYIIQVETETSAISKKIILH